MNSLEIRKLINYIPIHGLIQLERADVSWRAFSTENSTRPLNVLPRGNCIDEDS